MRRGGVVVATVLVLAVACHRKARTEAPIDAPVPSRTVVLDGGPIDASAGTALVDAGAFDAGSAPSTNADGWPRAEVDSACALYWAPGADAKSFPKPFAWEPCDSALGRVDGGAGLACRQLVGGVAKSATLVDVDAKASKVTFAIERFTGPNGPKDQHRQLYVVGEADGPIHVVLESELGTTNCSLVEPAASSTHVTYELTGLKGSTSFSQRIAVPSTGPASPSVLAADRTFLAPGRNEWFAADATDVFALSWDDGRVLEKVGALGDLREAATYGDLLAIQGYAQGSVVPTGANLRTVLHARGAQEIELVHIDPNDDPDGHFEDGFATDGIDMVWVEGTGHPEPDQNPEHWATMWDGPWKKVDLMTAPFTTDAKAIKRRRVGSGGSHASTTNVVGCGYVASELAEGSAAGYTQITRLADGRTWRLPGNDIGRPQVHYVRPLAITCTEVFALINVDNFRVRGLTRIRLDSLGPGEAAR